jgi:hypothetical protein
LWDVVTMTRFSAAQTADPVALVQLYRVPVSGDDREAQLTELVAMLMLWRRPACRAAGRMPWSALWTSFRRCWSQYSFIHRLVRDHMAECSSDDPAAKVDRRIAERPSRG